MLNDKIAMVEKPKINRVEVYWHTVTYKTVAIYLVILFAILMAACYLIFPERTSNILQRVSDSVMKHSPGSGAVGGKQARFVNLDGKVQVKKVDSVQWTSADYRMTLDKGDLCLLYTSRCV